MTLLGHYRVLDCCDETGVLAGLLLAQFGAEVIMVEPPHGSPARHAPPCAADIAGIDRSLVHLAYNRGKRSVICSNDEEFAALAGTADVVLHSGSLPVAVADLEAENPGLVSVSITGFGSDGPKAAWLATDLIVAAASSHANFTGDADRPPLRCAVAQTFNIASVDAVVGTLIALADRRVTGKGQRVDISAQHSFSTVAFHNAHMAAWGAAPVSRSGGAAMVRGIAQRWEYWTLDGAVTVALSFGGAGGPFVHRLTAWMAESAAIDDDLAAEDWLTFGRRLTGELDPVARERYGRLTDQLAAFLAKRPTDEIHTEAVRRRLAIAPMHSLAALLAFDQLAARDYWDEITVDGASAKVPGSAAKIDGSAISVLEPAPALGAASLGELLAARGPSDRGVAAPTMAPPRPPLAGLRVLDLSTSAAGPVISHTLAAFGASVLKVESATRGEMGRSLGPWVRGRPDASAVYTMFNAGKRSITLDLANPAGRGVLFDLVRNADVLVESFPAGVTDRLKIPASALADVNPALVVLSSNLSGQTGPLASAAGWGNMASALYGFHTTTGWPGRPGVGPVMAYTDGASPRFATAVLLAVLDARTQAGGAPVGCHIDFSQGESVIHLLGPALLDWQVNARVYEGQGNDDHFMAPHAMFPVQGDDRWVAIACATDAQWRALADVAGLGDLRDLDVDERLRRHPELEARIGTWTQTFEPDELHALLQSLGVPAHGAARSQDLAVDQQLAHRGYMTEVEHATVGPMKTPMHPIVLSRTPAGYRFAGPLAGEHSVEVLNELGYDDDRIAEVIAAGALE